MSQIERFFTGAVITAASSAATTTPRVPFGRYSGGGVVIPSTGGVTQIRWHASSGAEDTPVQIYADGAAVTTAVTAGAFPFPDACYGFAYVAPVIVGAASLPLSVTVKG